MSLDDRLAQLESILQEKHPEFQESLLPGRNDSNADSPIRQWFAWHNGSDTKTDNWFRRSYRFVSLEEAQAQVRDARTLVFRNPVQALFFTIFAGRMYFAWPLVVDASGDGYHYHKIYRTVFHRFEGERDSFFSSVPDFIDFRIEIADFSNRSQNAMIEHELELLQKYTQNAG